MSDTNEKQQPASNLPLGRGPLAALAIAVVGFWMTIGLQNVFGKYLNVFNKFPFSRSGIATVDAIDTTNQITYRGRISGNIEHFQNVFYAEDTSGQNRFAPPKPFLAPSGFIVDASEPGAWCSQGLGPTFPFASEVTNVSENCLSLWIARPRGTKANAELPVAVYIHGGGHGFNSAYEILYTPDGLIEQSVKQGEPIIHVALKYRVGLFRFAYTDALQARNHTNAGIRDQLAAFEWVQRHISTFGGDPERVTAIGNSAGASDIGLHLTSFGGNKGVPFHRALMISAAPNSMFNLGRDDTKDRTHLVAENVGCSGKAYPDSGAITQCLREVKWEKLMNDSVDMMRKARPPFGEQFFAPRIDKDIIPGYPSVAMREGRFNKDVPLIASWNSNDGAWLPSPTMTTDDEVIDSIAIFVAGMSPETREKVLELYPKADFEHLVPPESGISVQYFRAAQISRDFWFTCPTIDYTWHYARHAGLDHVRLYENNQTRFTPVFTYMGAPFWGVAHLSDIPYIFNVQDLPGGIDSSPEQLTLAKEMSSQVIAFVSSKAKSPDSRNFPADWTPAFTSHAPGALKAEYPEKIDIKVFDGKDNTGMASVSRKGNARTALGKRVEAEKLFARCGFINSPKVRLEMSV